MIEECKAIFFLALSYFAVSLASALHRWAATEEGHLEMRQKEFKHEVKMAEDDKDDGEEGEEWKEA